jgi:uncharacterized membrane protein YeaQ/YmgE (transglycosylase-associated protein family)
MWDWIAMIAVGIVVGALGRLLHPGRDWINLLGTFAIGVSSLAISQAIFSRFLVALVVGVLVAAAILTGYAWYARTQFEHPEV